MKIPSFFKNFRAVTLVLCLASVTLNSCVSSSSRDQVVAGTMDAQLEQKILRETGVSGAAIGVLAGAAAGAGIGVFKEVVDSAREGREFNRDRAENNAKVGAVAGGVTGGFIGYQQGRQQGEQLVVKAMSRDNIEKLLAGARAYNKGLKSYNASLRQKISATRKLPDGSEKKSRLRELEGEATGQLAATNERLDARRSAVQNSKWNSSQRQQYENTIRPLTEERDSLKRQVNQMAELRSGGTY